MSVAVELREVSRHFGNVHAVAGVNLAIDDGEFFSMLGPSGSGKTTCLRLIGGFDLPSSGHIFLHGRDASDLPPYERDVNTVFQDYALFPHLSVVDNVAYGLRMKGVGRQERRREAELALAQVALAGLGDRRPGQLSGGQRQRVALARALVNKPRVLLLDEPLGALDLKLREQMQAELKGLQRRIGITFVYVTHDQGEALSMSDRVAVFNHGRVEQVDTPANLYARPRTVFVARFVGTANVLEGEAAQRIAGSERPVSIRPEHIRFGEPASGHIGVAGQLVDVQFHGATSRFDVRADGASFTISMPNEHGDGGRAAARGRVGAHRLAARRHGRARSARGGVSGPRRSAWRRLSTFFYRRGRLALWLLLGPPLLWFGVVFVGSLLALLWQSAYTFDDFTMAVRPDLTWANYKALFDQANLDIVLRTLGMAVAVTIASALIGFPIAYYMARYATGRTKGFFYVAVMLPMWASYIVKAYAWTVILARGGIIYWFVGLLGLDGALEWVLAQPVIGGSSLSTSNLGRFMVFTYVWLPFMILPMNAALERIPESLLQASADLGARPWQTLRTVILPLALPGVAAGSIFTFSLTLGDYIIPTLVGPPGLTIGTMVNLQQGSVGNLPMAAAFTAVPIAILAVYLWGARRLGAFDAI